LIEIFAVLQLASLAPVSRTGVVVNVLNPGLVNTGLTRYVKPETRDAIEVIRQMFARTAEMGSRTILHAMVAGKESHGAFVSDCKLKK
jgi:NAD(P)-dependent dehydrogenase (short-subunit alcohol dehydrogenase family)